MERIKKIFKLDAYRTKISVEIQAGFVLFMTVAYVFAVHPAIMSAGGIPVGATVVITALIAGAATLFMSLYANKPFVLLPGMGLNAIFVYTLVLGYGIPWQEALGIVFIAGVLFIIMSFLKIRSMIADVLPKGLKNSLAASVGLFLTGLGLNNIGLISYQNGTLGLGSLNTPAVLVASVTLIITVILMVKKVRAAMLIGIVAGTALGVALGITKVPHSLVTLPPSISDVAFKLDILGALKIKNIPYIFVFFYSNFMVTLSLLLGLGVKAGYLDENGTFPDINKPFLVDACATAGGALLGTSPVVTYVESAAGIESGGRTGLASLTASILFFAMVFLVPIATMFPPAATAPVLIIIGMLMLEPIKHIDFTDLPEAVPAFLVMIFSSFTFDIAMGISLGIIAHIIISVVSGKAKEVHWSLYVIGILMVYYVYTTI